MMLCFCEKFSTFLISQKKVQKPGSWPGSGFHHAIYWKKFAFLLKIPTKFSVIPQSFYQNETSVQDQDQDQDDDFTLDFNTRLTYHT